MYHDKTINQSMCQASENSQHRTGDKLGDLSCEVKPIHPFHESYVVVVNMTSQSRNPYPTNRGYCYTVLC